MSASIRLFLILLIVTAAIALGVGIVFNRAVTQQLAKCTSVEQALGECTQEVK